VIHFVTGKSEKFQNFFLEEIQRFLLQRKTGKVFYIIEDKNSMIPAYAVITKCLFRFIEGEEQ